MFIRKSSRIKNGVTYNTYRLVEGYRNENNKVVQRLILNLGANFNVPQASWYSLIKALNNVLLNINENDLFDIDEDIIREAKRIAHIIQIKRISTEFRSYTTEETIPLNVNNDLEDTDSESIIKEDTHNSENIINYVKNMVTVDINSIKTEEVKSIGIEYIAFQVVQELGLPNLLESSGLNKKQVSIALANIIARVAFPSSELKTFKYLVNKSALDELLGVDFSKLQLHQLYKASDRILAAKEEIENSLYQREKYLYDLEDSIILYDITNTYFEGSAKQHELAHKGRSKEKRNDVPLISLGLVLDGQGFPKRSKILAGNVSEPSTLQEMLSILENENSIVIMDAGIATQSNITYLKSKKMKYIVVNRSVNQEMPTENITVKDVPNNKVKVAFIKNEDQDEVMLYCHSTAKENKKLDYVKLRLKTYIENLDSLSNNFNDSCLIIKVNQSSDIIIDNQSAVILYNGSVLALKPTCKLSRLYIISDYENSNLHQHENLQNIFKSQPELLQQFIANQEQPINIDLLIKVKQICSNYLLLAKTGTIKNYDRLLEKLGRLKEKFKDVSRYCSVQIITDKDKELAYGIKYTITDLDNSNYGIYCLRSNCIDFTETQLWHTYTLLTTVESSFRSLKTELGLRPIYHQKQARIDGHIFISIIAYHIVHNIQYKLHQSKIFMSFDNIRNDLSNQYRLTTSLTLANEEAVKVRHTSEPTYAQKRIYASLKIKNKPLNNKLIFKK